MKWKTMEKLMGLPQESQDKVWKLAMDRLKQEQVRKKQRRQPEANGCDGGSDSMSMPKADESEST